MKFKVMVIDDDNLFNQSITQVLNDSGYEVVSYLSGEEALRDLRNESPDVVLLDIFLKGENGIDVLKQLKQEEPALPVIMITAYSDVNLAVQAIKLGAEDFILKPLDFEHLEITMQKAIKNIKLQREVQQLKEQLFEYADNGNLREWEVYRALRDTAGGNYSFLQPPVKVPSYADSTIPSFGEDSIWVYYKVIPVGNDRFLGKPGIIRLTLFRKSK